LISLDVASRTRDFRSFQDYGSLVETNHPHSDAVQVSPKLTLRGDWAGALVDAVVGVDWADWTYQRHDDAGGFVTDERGTQRSQAFYARSNLSMPSGWRFDAGWRTERFDQSLETLGSATPVASQPVLSAVEWGVSRVFSPQWSAFARTASSYRVATIDELRYLSAALLPQEARDWELGLRYADRTNALGLRVFQQDTRNEIQYDNNVFSNINLDPVHREGMELDAQFQATEATQLRATVQAVKAVISEGVYAGNRLPLTAQAHAVFKVSHQLAPRHAVDGVVRLVGKAPFGNDWSNQCARDIPAASFLDLAYRYSAAKETGWSVRASVDNLLDRQGYSLGYTNAACSAYNVYPDDGRRLRLRATYDFK